MGVEEKGRVGSKKERRKERGKEKNESVKEKE